MRRFPIRYVHRNLLLGPGGEAAALYRVAMSSYPYLSTGEKWALARRLERLAHTIGADFQLLRVTRAYRADRYVEQARGLLDERHQGPAVWEAFLDGQRERIATLEPHLPEVYLLVSLAQRAPHAFGGAVIRASDRARARMQDMAGVGSRAQVPASTLRRLSTAEQRLYERLSAILALRRARTLELQWLVRRAAARGLTEPALERHWRADAVEIHSPQGEHAYEPLGASLWRLSNCAISEHERSLIIDGEEGRSHQAMLALGSLAESPQFPGAAAELLFAPLEAVEFGVDAVLHARWLPNREALRQVRKRIADVEHAYREQVEGSAFGPGLRAEEDRVLAREYEARLQGGEQPAMLTGWVSLALGAPTQEELERRVQVLRERYGDVQLFRPAGLQHQLFFDHLPRPDGGLTSDYIQQVTLEQFGAMVPTATRAVGSEQGPYLGYTPTGVPRPVRYDPTQAPREDRASAVLLLGTLGSGKTVTSELISYAAQRRGSLVVDFDPKPDHGWQNVPELQGDLDVLELSGDVAQQGRLDPLAIGLEELREELACSYLLDLLPGPTSAWENAITRAVRDAVREGSRATNRVIELLLSSERSAAQEAGEALQTLSDFGLARLGFASGEQSVAQAGRAVTTIRMPGLTLPEPGASRDTYTRSERVSVATLNLVAAYALRLISHDRSRHKVISLGEAWFFLQSQRGRQIIKRLVREGRAFNASVLLDTQLLGDLGDLAELIGVTFVFGQSSDRAAAAALRSIGLEPTRALIAHLLEARAGRCLMRDLDGRVGEVQVDLVFPHLLEAFNTTPGGGAA